MSSSTATARKWKRGNRHSESSSATLAALELPDIPGVPIDVLPAFVHAIRVATKFYAKCHEGPYYGEEEEEEEEAKRCNKNGHDQELPLQSSSYPASDSTRKSDLVNSLIQRFDVATESNAPPNSEQQELQQRKERMHNATGRWLKSVKRFAKGAQRREEQQTEEQSASSAAPTSRPTRDDDQKQQSRISVPYACFLYIWDLQQNHERIAVRRAGLFLSGLLWQRSKDCRLHLEQDGGDDTSLDTWMKATLLDGRSVVKGKEDVPLLQLEAHYWLHYLVQQGYAQFYPKIQVALQRLRQMCPHLEAAAAAATATTISGEEVGHHSWTQKTTFTSMADWRRIRDIALENGAKEITHVERWIERSYQCLEILVPRMGMIENEGKDELESSPTTAKIKTAKHKEANVGDTVLQEDNDTNINSFNGREKGGNNPGRDDDDDGEDDEDIDWEDGMDDKDDNFEDGTATIRLPDMDHFTAVERTLKAMESAGGLKGGGLEIDLRDNPQRKSEEEIDTPLDDNAKQARAAALTKLQKCVSILAKRHIPRLTIWLEGLANADNLVVSKDFTSIVSMPSNVTARRQQLLRILGGVKQRVSTVLNSAMKLNAAMGTEADDMKHQHQQASQCQSHQDNDAPLSLRLYAANAKKGMTGRQNLLSTIQRNRKPKSRHARSNRIQIKFRSRQHM